MMEGTKWVRLDDLRRHLHRLLKESRAELAEVQYCPIEDAEDAQALADAYLWNEAEEELLADVGQWAMCNAVEGVALPTVDDGIF